MRRFAAIMVGGGLAGSAVALGLARAGHPVAMIERSRYQAWRIGESLPPHAIPLLDAMGCSTASTRRCG